MQTPARGLNHIPRVSLKNLNSVGKNSSSKLHTERIFKISFLQVQKKIRQLGLGGECLVLYSVRTGGVILASKDD